MSFLLAIAVGTILLMLPVSTAPGETTGMLTALFTATTSVCVTGLVVADTYAHWSVFGQLVILLLIQVGGLGIITVASMIMLLGKQKFYLRDHMLLGESLSVPGAIGTVLIGVGTMLMIEKKDVETMSGRNSSWLLFAIGSAVFAALTSILGKIGIEGVESNLGTAIRTIVVLGMSWLMVFVMKKQTQVREVKRRDAGFLVLSGLATGASWLCFFKALQDGPASIVVPIDKLSILVTILFSFIVFRETLNSKSAAGLIGIVAGTMMLLI